MPRLTWNANGAGAMTFDPTITLGAVVSIIVGFLGTICATAVVCFVFVWTMRSRIDTMEKSIASIHNDLSSIKSLLEITTRQDERLKQHAQFINELRSDIHEIRRGESFVVPLGGRNKTAFGEG